VLLVEAGVSTRASVGGIGGGIASDDWEQFYAFNARNVADFPLATALPLSAQRTLDT
jgi:hypothetical protein